MTDTKKPTRLLTKKEVMRRTGIPHSTLYKAIFARTFPAPIKLDLSTNGRSVRWIEEEIEEWIENKIRNRDSIAEPTVPPTRKKRPLGNEKDGPPRK